MSGTVSTRNRNVFRIVNRTATTPRPIATVADDREGGQRRAPEGAQREPDVADGVVDERGAALVAAFVGDDGRRSEPRLRLSPAPHPAACPASINFLASRSM